MVQDCILQDPSNRPDGAFYLRPREKPTGDVWYTAVAIGHNSLGNTVKRLCDSAGVQGYFTNHSLGASTATRLFEAGVDEQLIMLRTGHSTTSGVRSYKRIGEKLRTVTSSVLNRQDPKRLKVCTEVDNTEPLVSPKENIPPDNSGTVPAASSKSSPIINFSGASHFTVNFNF